MSLKKDLRSISRGINASMAIEQKAREDKKKLRNEKDQLVKEFVTEAARSFCEDMRESYAKHRYVIGTYSSDFTRHVARNGVYLNAEHLDAQRVYNEALEKLNDVFSTFAKNNPDEFVRSMTRGYNISLKNLSN